MYQIQDELQTNMCTLNWLCCSKENQCSLQKASEYEVDFIDTMPLCFERNFKQNAQRFWQVESVVVIIFLPNEEFIS